MSAVTARQLAAAKVQHALDYIDRFAGRHHGNDKPARDALVIALLKQRAGSAIFRVTELEAVIGDAAPAVPDTLQTTVVLTERITGTSIELAVDYRVIDDGETDISAPTAMDIEIVAAWAGTQNAQHWLDEGSHNRIRTDIAEQLGREVEQVVAAGAEQQQAEVAEVL
jgi:hypothetical protein